MFFFFFAINKYLKYSWFHKSPIYLYVDKTMWITNGTWRNTETINLNKRNCRIFSRRTGMSMLMWCYGKEGIIMFYLFYTQTYTFSSSISICQSWRIQVNLTRRQSFREWNSSPGKYLEGPTIFKNLKLTLSCNC